jgi:hypothetical protein
MFFHKPRWLFFCKYNSFSERLSFIMLQIIEILCSLLIIFSFGYMGTNLYANYIGKHIRKFNKSPNRERFIKKEK